MVIKEAILKSLEDLKTLSTHNKIYKNIIDNYYKFTEVKISTLKQSYMKRQKILQKKINAL